MQTHKIEWTQIGIGIAIGFALALAYVGLSNRIRPAPIAIVPAATATPLVPTSTPGPLSVYVNGAVQQAGVYQLPRGARVADALAAAGGFSADALSDAVNLAAPLNDGVQVFVPHVGDSAELTAQLLAQTTNESAGATAGLAAGAADAGGMVNLNTASSADLETLPGVGEATAKRILEYRENNGRFATIEEVMNVSGIGEGKFEQMKDLIFVGE